MCGTSCVKNSKHFKVICPFYKLWIGAKGRNVNGLLKMTWQSRGRCSNKNHKSSLFLFPFWPLGHSMAIVYSIMFCTHVSFFPSLFSLSISIAIILIFVRFITSLEEVKLDFFSILFSVLFEHCILLPQQLHLYSSASIDLKLLWKLTSAYYEVSIILPLVLVGEFCSF